MLTLRWGNLNQYLFTLRSNGKYILNSVVSLGSRSSICLNLSKGVKILHITKSRKWKKWASSFSQVAKWIHHKMVPCKCYLIKWLLVCTVPLTGGPCTYQPRHMAHLRMLFTQSQVPVLLCEFSVTTVFPHSSYELDLSTSFLVTCYCHGTKPTVSYIFRGEGG